ncbi:MAG: glucose-6-phosphate isomerase [Hyphomicrobiaceae bacterium]
MSNTADAPRLPYVQSIAGCLPGAIGEHGLSESELLATLAKLSPHLTRLADDEMLGRLPLLTVPDDTADIEAARAALEKLSDGARTLIFFGTGGSGLGGQTLAQLAGWNIAGGVDEAQKKRPRMRFYDNLDPATLQAALASLDLASSRFVVISKSGNTPETLVQAIAALDAVMRAGLKARIPSLFLGLTEPAAPGKKNGLRQLLEGLAVPVLEHHTGIGGRFSALTNVGLLPAMARGLDVAAIRRGARIVVDGLRARPLPMAYPPALGAAIAIGLSESRGIRVQVMMPYADRLGMFSHWFVQLWAESLGKKGCGTTPIACLGPLDQHSQLQLFMDGPREHLMTVLRVATAGKGNRIDAGLAKAAGLDEMADRTVGDLVAAQAQGVPQALSQAGRPVRTFDIPRLDEEAIGALMMHFMIETILAGRALGIDPFDQPAVELAKVLSRERLVKAG